MRRSEINLNNVSNLSDLVLAILVISWYLQVSSMVSQVNCFSARNTNFILINDELLVQCQQNTFCMMLNFSADCLNAFNTVTACPHPIKLETSGTNFFTSFSHFFQT